MNYFRLFFNLVIANADALFAAFCPLSNGSGKLILGVVWMTPSQLILKLSWDSKRPASSHFTLEKRKKACCGNIRPIGRMAEKLVAFCYEWLLDRGGSVNLLLSQNRNQSRDDNLNRFFLKTFNSSHDVGPFHHLRHFTVKAPVIIQFIRLIDRALSPYTLTTVLFLLTFCSHTCLRHSLDQMG